VCLSTFPTSNTRDNCAIYTTRETFCARHPNSKSRRCNEGYLVFTSMWYIFDMSVLLRE